MIHKYVSFSMKPNTLHILQKSIKAPFSSSISVQNIRNSNLKFDSDDYVIHLYPFYPQVYKKKDRNIYEVNSNTAVLAFIFLNKNADSSSQWETRKSVSLKFKELGQILSAQIRSGNQVTIQAQGSKSNPQIKKLFILKDLTDQKRISIELTSNADPSKSSSLSSLQPDSSNLGIGSLKTTMSYSEYLIMYKLIENSLLDLSGWKFMMQIQKKIQLNKMDTKIIDDKEVNELLKNN